MSVREKGPRSAWSSPTRPFSRPVRRADRAETGVSTYAASPFTAEKDSLAEGDSAVAQVFLDTYDAIAVTTHLMTHPCASDRGGRWRTWDAS